MSSSPSLTACPPSMRPLSPLEITSGLADPCGRMEAPSGPFGRYGTGTAGWAYPLHPSGGRGSAGPIGTREPSCQGTRSLRPLKACSSSRRPGRPPRTNWNRSIGGCHRTCSQHSARIRTASNQFRSGGREQSLVNSREQQACLNRPDVSGDSHPWEGWSHVRERVRWSVATVGVAGVAFDEILG